MLLSLPHLITLLLWCLLVPCSMLTLCVASAQVRLALCQELGRFLFLSFLLFYTWTFTKGTNEALIDLLMRLYIAIDASLHAFTVEYWRLHSRNTIGGGKSSQNEVVSRMSYAPPSGPDRTRHLVFTVILLLFAWSWLIYGFTQLHLK